MVADLSLKPKVMIVEIQYEAKCKHCKSIKPRIFGKMKRHICTNPESKRFDMNPYLSRVALKDKACEQFEL